MKGEAAKEAIKLAARRLFATRGVDAVSVREIVRATGQKNGASLHYYFGSKDALVRELVIDGARLIDDRRNAQLDALEAGAAGVTLRQAIEILVWPASGLGDDGREDDYLRFISTFSLQNRAAFEEILGDRWNRGYQRCLTHTRRLSPTPAKVLDRRLVFLSLSLRAIMTARETALALNAKHSFWTAPGAMDDLIDSFVVLVSPPGEVNQTSTRARCEPPPVSEVES